MGEIYGMVDDIMMNQAKRVDLSTSIVLLPTEILYLWYSSV